MWLGLFRLFDRGLRCLLGLGHVLGGLLVKWAANITSSAERSLLGQPGLARRPSKHMHLSMRPTTAWRITRGGPVQKRLRMSAHDACSLMHSCALRAHVSQLLTRSKRHSSTLLAAAVCSPGASCPPFRPASLLPPPPPMLLCYLQMIQLACPPCHSAPPLLPPPPPPPPPSVPHPPPGLLPRPLRRP